MNYLFNNGHGYSIVKMLLQLINGYAKIIGVLYFLDGLGFYDAFCSWSAFFLRGFFFYIFWRIFFVFFFSGRGL